MPALNQCGGENGGDCMGTPPDGMAHPADPQAGLGPAAVRKMSDKTFQTLVYLCVKNIFCLAARIGKFF
jgi:hypothetical protein